jgi:hypothetical protein
MLYSPFYRLDRPGRVMDPLSDVLLLLKPARLFGRCD